MGKRSSFERNPRDYYVTPLKAVFPLVQHLKHGFVFIEPCAGDGSLVKHLESLGGECRYASDIEPQGDMIAKRNALDLPAGVFGQFDCIITNTPWDRKILHPMIEHFRTIAPAWLLLDADYAHTKQAIPYMKFCSMMVSVGRVRWIADSKMDGKDNCAWFRFEKTPATTVFKTKEE